MDNEDIDDEDLEAELAALTAGNQPRRSAPKKGLCIDIPS